MKTPYSYNPLLPIVYYYSLLVISALWVQSSRRHRLIPRKIEYYFTHTSIHYFHILKPSDQRSRNDFSRVLRVYIHSLIVDSHVFSIDQFVAYEVKYNPLTLSSCFDSSTTIWTVFLAIHWHHRRLAQAPGLAMLIASQWYFCCQTLRFLRNCHPSP